MAQENNTDIQPGTPAERKGLALSALIIASCALLCAFVPGWLVFSLICAAIAIAIAVFCISKAKKPGGKARLALWALGIGILAILAAVYFLLTRSNAGAPPVTIEEQVQQVSPADQDRGAELLRQATDTTNQQH